MAQFQTLDDYLGAWTDGQTARVPVAETVSALAKTAIAVARLIARGRLSNEFGAVVGETPEGDAQKALDVQANDLFFDGLKNAPVAVFGSEEDDEPISLRAGAPLSVAIDPLDGSSNVDTNISVGTIFSIMPMTTANPAQPLTALLQKGSHQLAAGFVVYGPQTVIVLTVGAGTHVFTLDQETGQFALTDENVAIPEESSEYAINASNYRHWDEPIRAYVEDCVAGVDGPRGKNFNMRWIASMVAEAFRILMRGGVYLYPADARPGYGKGRLRLVYEANPIAWLMEQAGGAATNGKDRILDLAPEELHQRVPLVFGSSAKVDRVARYHAEPKAARQRSPLFGDRGLFRAG